MTSLRLTPEHTTFDSGRISVDQGLKNEGLPTINAQGKYRKRLVDRLDAPQSQLSDGVSSNRSASEPAFKPLSSQSALVRPSLRKDIPEGALVNSKAGNVSSAGPPTRPRATYARQRSHLSDMVDSLESSQGVDSQHSSQQSFSQQPSFSGLSKQMELDLEDSDEADAFSQIKSIHELRRGGAISKFEFELQTLLDDVESDSTPMRIRALLQLQAKVKDISFTRYFQDSGNLGRFTERLQPESDDLSATLMAVVLHTMAATEHPSPAALAQTLEALYRLPPRVMFADKMLSKTAKDRSWNFSKALIRDISDFEERWATENGRSLGSGSSVLLASMEAKLSTMVKIGKPRPRPSSDLLSGLLLALSANHESILKEKTMDDYRENLRHIFSILEIIILDRDLVDTIRNLETFSLVKTSLAHLLGWAHSADSELEKSCLKFIVSISNNHAGLCAELGDESLIGKLFAIIDDLFLKLAETAALEQNLDGNRLNAVILAIGCLLNFADCSDVVRERMLVVDSKGKCLADGLVEIFNGHFDQTSEVKY
jgi:hypothetical protein